jgi:hypothetical protein
MLREMTMATHLTWQEDVMSGNPDEAALVALVDVTRRRLAAIEEESDPSVWDRFARALIEGVYAVILGVTIGSWTVLGFVVWVPLLVRNTIFLAGTVFYVSLYRNQATLAYAQGQVQFAARFYARGFEHFLSFYRQRAEPYPPVGLFEPLTTMARGDLLVDGLWVVTVWGAAWRLATLI